MRSLGCRGAFFPAGAKSSPIGARSHRRPLRSISGRALKATEHGQLRACTVNSRRMLIAISPATRNNSPIKSRLFPITANAFRLNWQRLSRKAGIGDPHFHDLKHEAQPVL